MKKHCKDCNKVVLELTKGKIKSDIIYFCKSCWDKRNPKIDMPDAFKNIFGGFK